MELNEHGFFKKMPPFRKTRGHYGKTPQRQADLTPRELRSKVDFLSRLRELEAKEARQEIAVALQGDHRNHNDESFFGSSQVREKRYVRRASEPPSIPFGVFVDWRQELKMRRCAAVGRQKQKVGKQRRDRWRYLWRCLAKRLRR